MTFRLCAAILAIAISGTSGAATPPIDVVVVLDTSLAMTAGFETMREAAEQFLIRLWPGDRARLCVANDTIELGDAFTGDRDELVGAVRRIGYGNVTKLDRALSASLGALDASTHRRVVLVFTTGADAPSRQKLKAIAHRARTANVIVDIIALPFHPALHEDTVTDPYDDYDDPDEVNAAHGEAALRGFATDTGGAYWPLEEGTGSNLTRLSADMHRQLASIR